MTLNEFLMAAKKACYASETPANRQELPDGSTELRYTEGEYEYVDRFVGMGAFAGTEVVYQSGKPIWSMAYHGRVLTRIPEPQDIFSFLRKALAAIPEEAPLRGPDYLTDGNWSYENDVEGSPEAFTGTERIYFKGTRCYRLQYLGGTIKA